MTRIALALALALTVPSAAMGHGPGHHAHDHRSPAFAAGEPGDPKGPSRIVQVTMREGEDGRMLFAPDKLSLRRGEQVRFVLRNAGKIEHEFVLDTAAGNTAHKAEMAQNPQMRHDDPNALRLDPSRGGEVVWRFTRSGTFEFACLIPGHYEAGMRGTIVVR